MQNHWPKNFWFIQCDKQKDNWFYKDLIVTARALYTIALDYAHKTRERKHTDIIFFFLKQQQINQCKVPQVTLKPCVSCFPHSHGSFQSRPLPASSHFEQLISDAACATFLGPSVFSSREGKWATVQSRAEDELRRCAYIKTEKFGVTFSIFCPLTRFKPDKCKTSVISFRS